MDAAQVGFAAFDGYDAPHAAHVRGGHQAIAPFAAHDIRQFVQQRVMAAGDDQHACDLIQAVQQAYVHALPGFVAFHVLRDVDDAVGFDE